MAGKKGDLSGESCLRSRRGEKTAGKEKTFPCNKSQCIAKESARKIGIIFESVKKRFRGSYSEKKGSQGKIQKNGGLSKKRESGTKGKGKK